MPIQNFRTTKFPMFGQTFLVAGMAHPAYSQDIKRTLTELKDSGFDVIVSLEEESGEFLAHNCNAMNIDNYLIKVDDFKAPTQDDVYELIDIVMHSKMNSKNVAIHCKGGNGRTGTMLASLWLASEIEACYTKGAPSDVSYVANIELTQEIKVYGGYAKCSGLVHNIINFLRSLNKGNYSVECEEQVDFLNNLQIHLLAKMDFSKQSIINQAQEMQAPKVEQTDGLAEVNVISSRAVESLSQESADSPAPEVVARPVKIEQVARSSKSDLAIDDSLPIYLSSRPLPK